MTYGSRRPCREVVGLIEAQRWSGTPPWPKPKLSGPAKAGLAYEAQVLKRLPAAQALKGPWFFFRDVNGAGFCQPDALFQARGLVWVIESKLTFTWEADRQIDKLYLPVLRLVYPQVEFRGLIVCRGLSPDTPARRVVHSFSEAERASCVPILHWLGPGKGQKLVFGEA